MKWILKDHAIYQNGGKQQNSENALMTLQNLKFCISTVIQYQISNDQIVNKYTLFIVHEMN